MRTVALLSAAAIFLGLGAGPAARGEEFDFRRARWGMPKEEARESEKEAVLRGETADLLLYAGEVAGTKAWIFYLFEEDGLSRGICALAGDDQDTIIGDYYAARSFLSRQYGDPVEEETDPAPLREGFADRVTTWRTGRGAVHLLLTERDGLAAVEIHYRGRDG